MVAGLLDLDQARICAVPSVLISACDKPTGLFSAQHSGFGAVCDLQTLMLTCLSSHVSTPNTLGS